MPGNADISTEAVGGASAQDSVPQAPQAEIHVNVANVSTANTGPAVPRLDGLLVRSAFQKLKSAGEEIQAGIEEAVARQLQADEAGTVEVSQAVASETIETEPSPAEAEAGAGEMLTSQTTEAVDATPSSEEVSAPETPVSEPTDSKTVPPPGEMAQTTTAPPGIAGLFENASPEEITALRAYLQQLQAQKLEGSAEAPAPQPVAPKVSAPENVPQPAAPEPSVPESPSAEAVASMTAPVEPSGQQPETKQAGEAPSEQVVSDLKSSETDTLETGDSKTRTDYDAMLDFFVPVPEQAKETQPQQKLSATEPTGGPVADPDGKSTDDIYNLEASADEKPAGKDHPLESALDEELASKLDQVKASEGEPLPEAQEDGGKELSRLPRNVQAYYLQPLRRVAEYGVPSCDLQLRSYSLRPLESFCDFALRAAYYLGLPAYGPVPLPKIIERWTVPKSTFIYKKAQENFERITRRRLIQIRDGHPETVQIWLAFLQKHQQAAVGMKANMWEFSSIGKSPCQVFLLCSAILTLWARCCQGDGQGARGSRSSDQRQTPSSGPEQADRNGGEGRRVAPEREISVDWRSIHRGDVRWCYLNTHLNGTCSSIFA